MENGAGNALKPNKLTYALYGSGLGFAGKPYESPSAMGRRSLAPLTGDRYHGTLVHMRELSEKAAYVEVERVQTGVRMEKHLLKVLKAVAELKDMTLGDLLEGVILHAFEGKTPFSAETLKEIEQFKKIYAMTLRATDSHHLRERRK